MRAVDAYLCVQFCVEEASAKCRHGWMRTALHDWLKRKGWEATVERLENLSAAASSDDFPGIAVHANASC